MHAPSFGQALAYWHRLGWLSFGGPAGQIAMMHSDLVERRRWVDEGAFAHGLNYCMLLPGPEAMQLACYLGWRMHGLAGGLLAGGLFVLPGALLMTLLAWIYLRYGQLPAVAGVLLGLKSAVLGIVVFAVLKLGQRILRTPLTVALAMMALLALAVLRLPFPLVLLAAALAGLAARRWRAHWLPAPAEAAPSKADAGSTPPTRPLRQAVAVAAALLLAWMLPLLALALWLGGGSTAAQMGGFFSFAALVTIGGAYAVLPFVAQQAVVTHGWLSPEQMLVGLGLAETTPGPLVLVLLFVGFVGGWQHPDLASPLVAALLCGAVTLWATFLPSFLFVLPVAPWIERLRNWPQASAALGAITAAVVGVMANLGLWFGYHLLRGQDWPTVLWIIAIAGASLLALRSNRVPMPLLVLLAGLLGALAGISHTAT